MPGNLHSETTELAESEHITAAPDQRARRKQPFGKVLVVEEATYRNLQEVQKRLKFKSVARTVSYLTER